ncbi:MAG: hypothetical protein V7740_12980 [Pseudomonas marincola]
MNNEDDNNSEVEDAKLVDNSNSAVQGIYGHFVLALSNKDPGSLMILLFGTIVALYAIIMIFIISLGLSLGHTELVSENLERFFYLLILMAIFAVIAIIYLQKIQNKLELSRWMANVNKRAQNI